jgi:hypothetical protein
MTQEINLNHLTFSEYAKYKINPEQNNFERYKVLVITLFKIKEIYFFENELLKEYNVKTMQEILNSNPDRFFPAGLKHKDLKKIKLFERIEELKKSLSEKRKKERKEPSSKDFENTWYDIWLPKFNVTPKDAYYDCFFIYQLSNLDLLETDDFLNYQLETYFERNIVKFKRLVSLAIRKHGKELLKEEQIKTIEEWVAMIEIEPALSGTEPKSEINISIRRPKIKRDKNDKITALNLAQVAYLAVLLKQSNIALKDDIILTQESMGAAFHILTGYSENTLRQAMNLKGQNELTYPDRKTVREILYTIISLIDKDIDEQKGKKS